MRRRRHQWGARVLVGALFLSALIHAALWVPVREFVVQAMAPTGAAAAGPVDVVRLSPQAWQASIQQAKAAARRAARQRANPAPEAPRLPEAEEPDRPDPRREQPVGQIVDVPATKDDAPDPDARFAGEHNSRVERESVARLDRRDPTKQRRTNELQDKPAPPTRPEAQKTLGLTVEGEEGGEAERGGGRGESEGEGEGERQFRLEIPDLQRRDDVKLRLSDLPGFKQTIRNRTGSEALDGTGERFDFQPGAIDGSGSGEAGGRAAGKRSLPSLEALQPNLGTVARISGSPSMDYVEDVPEGDGTYLNTKEFKYATFFIRVKDSVQNFWSDNVRREFRRRDPTARSVGSQNRVTLLTITLNRAGALDDVRVSRSSGIRYLDDAAIQAMRQAEPFPNPPDGIVESDGSIRFNFQFVLVPPRSGPFGF
ncbi:MAG: energy transducer TonB [Myxococcota bacterium]